MTRFLMIGLWCLLSLGAFAQTPGYPTHPWVDPTGVGSPAYIPPVAPQVVMPPTPPVYAPYPQPLFVPAPPLLTGPGYTPLLTPGFAPTVPFPLYNPGFFSPFYPGFGF